jgi:hypothetical protein
MQKHLNTAKNVRNVIGRENIEVAEAWKHKPPRN